MVSRSNVIVALNVSIFVIYSLLLLWLFIKTRFQGLPTSAVILLVAGYLLSFVCKAMTDTFRAYLKGKINNYVFYGISLSTGTSDVIRVAIIYYFVMNVGSLRE